MYKYTNLFKDMETALDELISSYHTNTNNFNRRLILREINKEWGRLSGNRPDNIPSLNKVGGSVKKKSFGPQIKNLIKHKGHGDVKSGDLIQHIIDSKLFPERDLIYRRGIEDLTQEQLNLFADDIMRVGDKALRNWKTLVDADEAKFQEAEKKTDAMIEKHTPKKPPPKESLTQEAGQLLTKVGVKMVKKTAQVLGVDDPAGAVAKAVHAMPHVRQEQVGHVIDILPMGGKEKVLAKGAVKIASAAKRNLGLNRDSLRVGLNNPVNQQRIKNRAPRTSAISIMRDIINDPINRAILSGFMHAGSEAIISSVYGYVRDNWGRTYKPKPLTPEKIARESAKLDPLSAEPQPETKTPQPQPPTAEPDVEVLFGSTDSEGKNSTKPEDSTPPLAQTISTDTQTLVDQTPFDRDVRIEVLKKRLQELQLSKVETLSAGSHLEPREQPFTKKRKFRPELREFNPERLNFYVSKEHEDLERNEIREFKYIPEGSGVATYETEAGLNPIHNDNKLHDEIRYRGVISLMRDYEPPGYKFVLRREGSAPKPSNPVNPKTAERYDNNMQNSIRPAEPFRQRQYRELTDNTKGYSKEPLAMIDPIDSRRGIGSNQTIRNYIHTIGYRNIYK